MLKLRFPMGGWVEDTKNLNFKNLKALLENILHVKEVK